MTDPARSPGEPPRPPAVNVGPRPGRLVRWRLTQPVRLYCYSVLAAVAVAAVLVGALTQEWADALLAIVAAVLAVVPGAEAARLSVFTEAAHYRGMYEAVAKAGGGYVNLMDGRE
jgi:hypothetical protein